MKIINVPAPKAKAGDRVRALNYRARPARWEWAVVRVAKYYLPNESGNGRGWEYEVMLERRTPKGTYMHRTVGDDGISA